MSERETEWIKWLNFVSDKLGQQMKGLLYACYCDEIPYRVLETCDEAELYFKSRDKFTDDGAQKCLLNRLFLLGGPGQECLNGLASFGFDVPLSRQHVDGLSPNSELVECFVAILAKLDPMKRKLVLEVLATQELQCSLSNFSYMEIICKLFQKQKIQLGNVVPLADALRQAGVGEEGFGILNSYCHTHGLPTQSQHSDASDQLASKSAIISSGRGPAQQSGQVVHRGFEEQATQSFPVSAGDPVTPIIANTTAFEDQVKRYIQPPHSDDSPPLEHDPPAHTSDNNVHKQFGRCTELWKGKNCKRLIGKLTVMALLLALFCGVLLYFLLSWHKKEMTIRGIQGDTIFLANAPNHWYAHWHVKDCLQQDTHTSNLYLVPEDKLITHEKVEELRVQEVHAPMPSRTTGTITTTGIYMLGGSSIAFQICIASSSREERRGEAFVFADINDYQDFVNYVTTGQSTSIYRQPITIGANNDSACSVLWFIVNKPAYYFVTAETPANIIYTMNTTLHIMYLNHSNYDETCTLTQSKSCRVNIPGHFLWNRHYVLLQYIYGDGWNLTTHTCVSYWFLIPAIIFGFFVLLAVVLAVCIIVHHCLQARSSRSSYTALT